MRGPKEERMVGVRATKGNVQRLGGSARRNPSSDKPREMGSGEEERKRPVTFERLHAHKMKREGKLESDS
jgi:hypothetical protein